MATTDRGGNDARFPRRTFLRRSVRATWLVVLIVAAPVLAAAQGKGPWSFDELRTTVPQLQADAVLQVRVRWQTAKPSRHPESADSRFELVSVISQQTPIRPDRAPQVDSTSLIAVSLDANGRALDWRVLADPRIVRAEASETGRLEGRRLYRTDADLWVHVPDDAAIASVHLYAVRAASGRAALAWLGSVTLGTSR